MSITARHTLGWSYEEKLKPVFEELHNMTFIKTTKRYDSIDFQNPNLNLELKTRVGLSTQYPDWLLPAVKLTRAELDLPIRPTYFYYYWTGDKKLFRLKYDTTTFSTYRKEYPFYNPKQLHVYIPATEWEYIETLDI